MPTPPKRLACLMFIAWAVVASPVLADPPPNTELNGDEVEPAVYRSWAGNYRQFARYCGEIEGGFLVVPGYDRRIPSSRGLTLARATDELTETWRESTGGFSENRMRRPEPEEVKAYANILPDTRSGTYGYLDSVEIVKVLGPEEMLVTHLWLIDTEAVGAEYDRDRRRARANGASDIDDQLDALYRYRLELKERQDDEDAFEQTHRLVGYDTRGLAEGQRWDGPDGEGVQVAVAHWELPEPEAEDAEAEEDDSRNRRRRGRSGRRNDDEPRMLLVNPQPVLRGPLEERAMVRLLDARGYTIASFVEQLRDVRDRLRDRDAADLRMIQALLPPMPGDEEDDD